MTYVGPSLDPRAEIFSPTMVKKKKRLKKWLYILIPIIVIVVILLVLKSRVGDKDKAEKEEPCGLSR